MTFVIEHFFLNQLGKTQVSSVITQSHRVLKTYFILRTYLPINMGRIEKRGVFLKKLKLVGILLILGLLLSPIIYSRFTEMRFQAQIRNQYKKVQTHLPQILIDLHDLDQNPLFNPKNTLKDATDFMDQNLSWQGIEPEVNDKNRPLLNLFNKHPEWDKNPQNLQSLYNDPQIKNINVDWVEQLSQFDQWNYFRSQKIQNQLKSVKYKNRLDRFVTIAELPMPSLNELRMSGIVYFLKQIKNNQIDEEKSVIAKIAQLSHSSETLVGRFFAAQLLLDEIYLDENFKFLNLKTIAREKIESYKRVTWAWQGLNRLSFFHKIPKELNAYMKKGTGFCSTHIESPHSLFPVSLFLDTDLFKNRVIFEKDYAERFKESHKFREEAFAACGLKTLEGFLSRIPATDTAPNLNQKTSYTWKNLPYFKRSISLANKSLFYNNYFRLYEKN